MRPSRREIGPREIYQFAPTVATIQSEWTKTAGGGEEFTFPFQIYDVSAANTPKVHIRYGTMMDVVPTDIDTDLTLAAGTSYFYLKNEVDLEGFFVGSELVVGSSPQPADDDTYGYITLGQAIVVGTALFSISQAATHSLRMAVCGRTLSAGTAILEPGQFEFWGF